MQASDQKLTEAGLSATSKKVRAMRDLVFAAWERDVRLFVPGAQDLLHPILMNTLPVFYDNIAEALTPDHPREQATSNNDIAAAHGNERARMTSYGPEQIIHEYQLFRDAFSQVADEQQVYLDRAEWAIVNRSIDSAVRESVKEFTAMHDTFRHRVAASLSHDMRNPLSVLINAAQLLNLAPAPERTPGIVKRIVDNGMRLSSMIDELLDALSFHQGEQLPLNLSRFDALALIERIADDMRAAEGVDCVVVGAAVCGYWCKEALRRAIENLVSNAVKYGDSQTIRIKLDQTHGRMLVSVHNTGNPIAQEHQSHIFQYLWREDSARQHKGWGIGLPFVKNVAESHGGSVAVDSSPATGTTFLIDIPQDCRPFVDGADA